jgi:membrane protein DedA with SNARE-associated domain
LDLGVVWLEIFEKLFQSIMEGALPPLGAWSYILLAVLVAFEGPNATLLGAVVAGAGAMNPVWVFVAATVGNTCADVGWYLLGYLGRFEVLMTRFKWVRKQESHIRRLEREMQQHAVKILLVTKLTLSFVVPALVAAGMARVSIRRWMPVVVAAEFLWTGGLVIVGFHLTGQIKRLERGMQVLAVIGLIVFAGIVIWLIKRIFSTPAAQPSD